jgi:dethiobiotin synthetase
MAGLLITATDTDCGKTVLTCALVAYWLKYCQGKRMGVLKVAQSGLGDWELYQQLFGEQRAIVTAVPLRYQAPLAPPIAAALEGKRVDLGLAWQAYERLEHECEWVMVEGVGGLGSPVTDELTVADIAASWRLPIVLVVPIKLGAIAHTVANVALARQKGLALKGIVLNTVMAIPEEAVGQLAPVAMIEALTQVPVLGILPHFAQLDLLEDLSKAAQQLTLEAFIPKHFWAV